MLAYRLLALAGLTITACSSSHAEPPCANVDGTYEVSLTANGQSENLGGPCPVPPAAQVVDVTLSKGQVSLGGAQSGETCALCSSAGCLVDVVCGAGAQCPGTVTPPPAAGDGYLQGLTFVIPTGDASTENAVATFGSNFCGYEGTAVKKR
jgi:hypothetical protein